MIRTYVYIYYVLISLHTYIHTYVCIYVYMCVYIYICIYTASSRAQLVGAAEGWWVQGDLQ